jgi:coenzyme F420-reducing hydrogenase delta subunit/ferredoxin
VDDGVSGKEWRPKIVAFMCNWCTYVGADAAGTARLQYRSEVIPIRLQCTGRMDPTFILVALEKGMDGVIVSGCHPGDCHYVSGNLYARRRFTVFRALLEFLGIDTRRIQFAWVSATEGVKWAELVNDFVGRIEELGPNKAFRELSDFSPLRPAGSGRVPIAEVPKEESEPPDYSPYSDALKDLARDLLEKGEVGIVVGYGAPGTSGVASPAFAVNPEETCSLSFNDRCLNNLSVHLTNDLVRRYGKIGIVAKGCDVKSIVGLIQENQIRRDEIRIIGVVCGGMRGDDGRILEKCRACDVKVPHLYDYLIGEGDEGAEAMPRLSISERTMAEIDYVSSMPLEERWVWWQEQFSRCIKCYACRAVCPFCYCDRCIVDRTRPQWIPPGAHGKGVLSWMVVRAFHLAGRCTLCGECSRVCPAGIRLDLISARVAMEVQKVYGYMAGYRFDVPPPLQTFRREDEEDFIR